MSKSRPPIGADVAQVCRRRGWIGLCVEEPRKNALSLFGEGKVGEPDSAVEEGHFRLGVVVEVNGAVVVYERAPGLAVHRGGREPHHLKRLGEGVLMAQRCVEISAEEELGERAAFVAPGDEAREAVAEAAPVGGMAHGADYVEFLSRGEVGFFLEVGALERSGNPAGAEAEFRSAEHNLLEGKACGKACVTGPVEAHEEIGGCVGYRSVSARAVWPLDVEVGEGYGNGLRRGEGAACLGNSF